MTRAAREEEPTTRRVRPSRAAVAAALRALHEAGVAVARVTVTGSRIDIHCDDRVEPDAAPDNDAGLKKW